MLSLLIASALALAADDGTSRAGERIDADQFLRIIHSVYKDVRDVSFLYEGESAFVGPASILGDLEPEDLGQRYQFQFLYRSDGAVLIEGYHEAQYPQPTVYYKKVTLLEDRVESLNQSNERLTGPLPIVVRHGSPVTLRKEMPPPFFFVHILNDLRSPKDLSYAYHGWDLVDGHACLVVSLDLIPRSLNPKTYRHKLWIDLARGGHPLRIDMFNGEDLAERHDQIRLVERPAGKETRIWIPTECQSATYSWNGKYYKEPITKAHTTAVSGTLSVNQGMSNSTFSVESPTRLPETASLKKLRGKLRAQTAAAQFRPDAAGIAAELDRKLAEADRKGREITASSPARSWWSETMLLQAGAVGIGLGALVVAFWMTRGGGS